MSQTLIYRGYYICPQEDGDGGTDYHIYADRNPESYLASSSSEDMACQWIDQHRRMRIQAGLNPVGKGN